jgi:hypothetical protein
LRIFAPPRIQGGAAREQQKAGIAAGL